MTRSFVLHPSISQGVSESVMLFIQTNGTFREWKSLTKHMLLKVILKHPKEDMFISPYTFTTGCEVLYSDAQRAHDNDFGCQALSSPVKRNAYRLYTTLYYAYSGGTFLGHPKSELSKIRAVQEGHLLLISNMPEEVRESFCDIYLVIFTSKIIGK